MSGGAGRSPAGRGAYGLGTPIEAPIPGGKANRIAATALQDGGRYIDPVTKDYVFDEYGRAVGYSSARQLVYLRMKTRLGTSAVKALGNELHTIDRIGASFQKRVDNTIRAALSDIVALGLIEVVSVSAEKIQPGRSFIRVKWRDLTTTQEHETLT
jgi:hypothetical protein